MPKHSDPIRTELIRPAKRPQTKKGSCSQIVDSVG
jgi:hypothetical protein